MNLMDKTLSKSSIETKLLKIERALIESDLPILIVSSLGADLPSNSTKDM